MPETDQASQFITALEPFYKVAYDQGEKAPPIFNIFSKKHNLTPSFKMNGHVPPLKENGNEQVHNTSAASAMHNITWNVVPHDGGLSNGAIQTTGLLNNGDMIGVNHSSTGEAAGKTFALLFLLKCG